MLNQKPYRVEFFLECMKYKFLSHTADAKFQAFGNSLEGCFENSAYAMKELICGKIKIRNKIQKKIKIHGNDMNNLLYNFLEEFLYLLDAENFIFARISKIDISPGRLVAELIGDDASNYKICNDVKAITYNEMKVEKRLERGKSRKLLGYTIEFVVDV